MLMRVGEGVVARVWVQRSDACSDLESAPGVAKKKKEEKKTAGGELQGPKAPPCPLLLTAHCSSSAGARVVEARAPIAFAIRAHGWVEALTSLRDAGSTGVRLGESLE